MKNTYAYNIILKFSCEISRIDILLGNTGLIKPIDMHKTLEKKYARILGFL